MAESQERSLVYEGLKHYFLIRFAQRPVASTAERPWHPPDTESDPHCTPPSPPTPPEYDLRVAGALREFVSQALGPGDDISRFEYLKKTARESVRRPGSIE